MGITDIPNRNSNNVNASADINTLNDNDQDLQTQISAISSGGQGITFTLRGSAVTGTKQTQILMAGSATISKVIAYADTAPTGASLIVDVNKNGTTIFTTQANRPQIAAGTNTDDSGTPDVTALVQDDRVSVDVDQVGSTIAGGDDLMVTVVFS